ncbi:MAG: PilZ domain-containing protein [Candidatus Omnitrophica bacterium]|nr:PilZ domain-containing protein [Candidatus Omnitrophota bacterium]
MRNILSFLVIVITFSSVIFLLWRQRVRNFSQVKATLGGYWDDSEEKRRFRRFKKELNVNCNIPGKSGYTYKTFTKNVSGEGICLSVPEMIPQGGIVELEIGIPDNRYIRLTGETVWVNEIQQGENGIERVFNAGIRFLKISDQDRVVLNNFLNEIAR